MAHSQKSLLALPSIFLIGPMGTGKSTIGKSLALTMQRDFYDVDTAIEEKAGVSVNWIFDVEGESGLRAREHNVVDMLTQKKRIVLATSGSAVFNPDNCRLLASRGLVVYLKTSLAEQYERTKNDTKRPLLKGANLEERLLELHRTHVDAYENLAEITFDTDGMNAKTMVQQILDGLLAHG